MILVGESLRSYVDVVETKQSGGTAAVSYDVPMAERSLLNEHPNASISSTTTSTWQTIANVPKKFKGINENYGSRYLFNAFAPSIPGTARVKGYVGIFSDTLARLRTHGFLPAPIEIDNAVDDPEL